MMIKEMLFCKQFASICEEGYRKGWHERNGGNLSYRLTPDEAALVKANASGAELSEYRDIGGVFPALAGEIFLVTGSGKYMRHVKGNFEDSVAIIEISENGDKYKILWGLSGGGKPTSELPTHLMNHEVKVKLGKDIRIIYHCHPTNIIAMSYLTEDNDRTYSNILWRTMTECSIVFPDGVGVVPWMVCGSDEIAKASADKMQKFNAVVWAHHGIFCAGSDFDEVFGLAETVEKSAEIYLKVLSAGNIIKTVSNQNLIDLSKAFGTNFNSDLLF